MGVFYFALLALAVHRATHLVTEDTFPPVRRLRDLVSARWPEGWQSYLVTCFWCVSFWVALAFALGLYWFAPGSWGDSVESPVVLVLALSTTSSVLQTVVEYLDVKIVNGG